MSRKKITPDLTIMVGHPTESDFVVDWPTFLERYDSYIEPSNERVSFTCRFIGSTESRRRIAIDTLIRRLLRSVGITRSESLPGSFTTKHVRGM